MIKINCRLCNREFQVADTAKLAKCWFCGAGQKVSDAQGAGGIKDGAEDEAVEEGAVAAVEGTQNMELAREQGEIDRAQVQNYIKRGNLALEVGRWQEAEEFFANALCGDPGESLAHLGKVLAGYQLSGEAQLRYLSHDLRENENFRQAYQFADEKMKKKLEEYQCHSVYNAARRMYRSGKVEEVKNALEKFESITEWKDSLHYAKRCKNRIRELIESSKTFTKKGKFSTLTIKDQSRKPGV